MNLRNVSKKITLQIVPIAALVSALSLSSCIESPCIDYLQLPTSTEFGAIGDSIIAGGSSTCTTIPAFLSYELGERIPNTAKSGAKVADIAERYDLLVAMHNPNTIIAEGCVNDLNPSSSPEDIAQDLLALFDVILDDGHDLIYLVQYELLGDSGILYNDDIAVIDHIVLTYCDDNPMTCIDMRPLFSQQPVNFDDEIHPSDRGRHLVVDALLEVL